MCYHYTKRPCDQEVEIFQHATVEFQFSTHPTSSVPPLPCATIGYSIVLCFPVLLPLFTVAVSIPLFFQSVSGVFNKDTVRNKATAHHGIILMNAHLVPFLNALCTSSCTSCGRASIDWIEVRSKFAWAVDVMEHAILNGRCQVESHLGRENGSTMCQNDCFAQRSKLSLCVSKIATTVTVRERYTRRE